MPHLHGKHKEAHSSYHLGHQSKEFSHHSNSHSHNHNSSNDSHHHSHGTHSSQHNNNHHHHHHHHHHNLHYNLSSHILSFTTNLAHPFSNFLSHSTNLMHHNNPNSFSSSNITNNTSYLNVDSNVKTIHNSISCHELHLKHNYYHNATNSIPTGFHFHLAGFIDPDAGIFSYSFSSIFKRNISSANSFLKEYH